MNKYIINRVINEANYIINTGDTIRKMALMRSLGRLLLHSDKSMILGYLSTSTQLDNKILFERK